MIQFVFFFYQLDMKLISFLLDRLTCIYSSCKVEENHVSAEELGKGIQQDHQIILNNEMIVLKVCHFHFFVILPPPNQQNMTLHFLPYSSL